MQLLITRDRAIEVAREAGLDCPDSDLTAELSEDWDAARPGPVWIVGAIVKLDPSGEGAVRNIFVDARSGRVIDDESIELWICG